MLEDLEGEQFVICYLIGMLSLFKRTHEVIFLSDYRCRTHAQFQALIEQVRAREQDIETLAARISSVLNVVVLPPVEGQRGAGGGPYRSIVDRCLTVWTNFRDFIHSVAHGTAVHVLAHARAHYPALDFNQIASGPSNAVVCS
jgi:hypothetical protein